MLLEASRYTVNEMKRSFVQKINSILEWTIVPWLLLLQLENYEACTLRQGWVKTVFFILSYTELHRYSNSDKDFVKVMKQLFSLI